MTASPAEGPVHRLDGEWVRGPDGLLFRRAARVILLDEADRVLLLRGHDADRPERSWWFTVGGGLEPGEDPAAGAARELAEETGLELAPEDLVGPVFTRSAVFEFWREHCRQDEVFFVGRWTGAAVLTQDRWTDIERDTLDEVRWWTLAEMDRTSERIYPAGLADAVRSILPGWDGVTRPIAG